ncbi:hypothetical protein UPYG_G00116460 [Umbra pygmaea]|uniref:Ig-like domain-containing protein n=1 Tax=Umbra pygmaea TaxID=75934 RepID=A0ABD0X4T7_UMBPY
MMRVRSNTFLVLPCWITSPLVFLVLRSGTVADSMVITSGNLTANIGMAVTLTCKVSEEEKVSQVEWRFGGCNEKKILVFKTNYPVVMGKEYEKRILDVTIEGLTLLGTQEKDTGTYCCSLTIFPSGTQQGLIYLNITNNTLTETPILIIVYIVCGILGALVLVGAVMVLLFKRCITSVQSPVHVAVHQGGLPHNRPSILQISPAQAAQPSGRDNEEEGDEEEGCNMDYLNVSVLRLPRIPCSASSALGN